jgi:hypothetical protein
MIGIIFLTLSLLISLGVTIYSIYENIRDRREYKAAEKNLKIGDKYMCTLNNGDNPFYDPIILEVTIIDKKYDGENRLWVKYKYLDDNIGMKKFERFYDEFDKIDE